MKRVSILILLLIFVFPFKGSGEIVDPFLNGVELSKIYEQKRFNYLKKLKLLEKNMKEKRVVFENKPKLFKTTVPPFEKLIFQGVISKGSELMLVAADPTSGKIYLLKKGDPVDVNAKILNVKEGKVIIRVFSKKNGKLIYKDNEYTFAGDLK